MGTYIEIPIETDAEQLVLDVYEQMAEAFPGWEPIDGSLEVFLFRALVYRLIVPLAELAVDVPAEIFAKFGQDIFSVVPIGAAPATGESTWTMVDGSGYTIPEGAELTIPDAAGELHGFRVQGDVQVLAGETATAAGEVILEAAEDGTEANDLTADPVLVEALSFVASVELVGSTGGGADGEEPLDYLNRLRDTLQTLSLSPVIPRDVEILARSVAGVARATAIDLYDPGTNEVQRVAATGGTAGDWTFEPMDAGQVTGALAFNITAATFQTALEALSNIEVGDVEVTGGPLNAAPLDVEFKGLLAATNLTTSVVTDNITNANPAVTTPTTGVAGSTDNEKTVSVAVHDVDGEPVSDAVATELRELLEAKREANFVFHVIEPTYNTINVNFEVVVFDGFDQATVEAAVIDALTFYLSPENWGRPPFGAAGEDDPALWLLETKARFQDLSALINNVTGVNYHTNLKLAKGADALGTSDVTMTGPAPLPRPGVIQVSAS